MVVVHREGSFRIVIFVADHEPPHVHVRGTGNAKIFLCPGEPSAEVLWSRGYSLTELRRALEIVNTNRPKLLDAWRIIRDRTQ